MKDERFRGVSEPKLLNSWRAEVHVVEQEVLYTEWNPYQLYQYEYALHVPSPHPQMQPQR